MSALDGELEKNRSLCELEKILCPCRFSSVKHCVFLKQPVSSKKVFSRELPTLTEPVAVFCGNLFPVKKRPCALRCWSRDFAAEPRKSFRKKSGGLRSGSAGSPGVGERSGTERSNERERRADIATAKGARARFLPARRNFLSSGRVFVFGGDWRFCARHLFFCFLVARKENFFHAAYDFGDALFF